MIVIKVVEGHLDITMYYLVTTPQISEVIRHTLSRDMIVIRVVGAPMLHEMG
jgi:hypothetical protein